MTLADRIQCWAQQRLGPCIRYRTGHTASRGVLVFLALAFASVLTVPPFEAIFALSTYASDDSAALSTSTEEKDPAEVRRPLSLAYVPRDAYVIAAIRPNVFLKSESLSALKSYLTGGMRQVGIVPEHLEQITLMYFSKESSLAYIVHLADVDTATKLATTMVPDPIERIYAGRKYWRKQNSGDGCAFADGKIVVMAPDEEHLRRLIIAGAAGAANAKWVQEWHAAANSDGLAIANIKALRGLAALDRHPNLPAGLPPEMEFMLGSSTARMAVKMDDNVQVDLKLDGHSGQDGQRSEAAVRSLIERVQLTLSSLRIDASKQGSEESAVMLSLFDLVDFLLDNVTIQTGEDTVELSVNVDQKIAAEIMKAIDAGYSRE